MIRFVLLVLTVTCIACGSSVDDLVEDLAAGGDARDTARQELLLRPKGALEPLLLAIEDPGLRAGHADMADVLVSLMLRLDDERLPAALNRHLLSHPDPAVRARIAFRTGTLKRFVLLDAVLQALQDSVSEVRFEALRTLNVLDNRLSKEQISLLDERAAQLADDAHEGIRGEALLRVEEQVDKMLAAASQLVTQARLPEADSAYTKATQHAPQSWKAGYQHARFWLDNGQQQAGLQRLRALGTVLDVAPMTVAPTIDGRLDEAVWAEATQAELPFLGYRGYVLPADMLTRVYIGYTTQGLYIGVHSEDSHIDSLQAEKTQRDDQVWMDESIELFLDANLDRRSYVQVIVNAIGTFFDASHENGLPTQDVGWTAAIAGAVHQGADFWSVEFRLPFDNQWLPQPTVGDMWGANFARNFRDRAHSSQWVYTYGEYHQVDGFGLLVFK